MKSLTLRIGTVLKKQIIYKKFNIKISILCFRVLFRMKKRKTKDNSIFVWYKDGGGSGFENLVLKSREGDSKINYEVVVVVSNHKNGELEREQIDSACRSYILRNHSARRSMLRLLQIQALSGRRFLDGLNTKGLNPKTTFNIHPGKLPEFGGDGMYGIHVHEAVIKAGASSTAVTMHFVTDIYDDGPVFLLCRLK